MRYAVDPRQIVPFDLAECMFSPKTIQVLQNDWPAVFRKQILHLMPVQQIADQLHPSLGCPTQELYGMAGTIFLKELSNLTIEEAVRRYLTDLAWQYALNVPPLEASMSHASIERYTRMSADHQGPKDSLRQAAAEQLLWLVEHFADEAEVSARTTYENMRRILDEQCDVTAAAVRLKERTSCEVMQNPSDPDATYDGHKGPGHQAQICETCSSVHDGRTGKTVTVMAESSCGRCEFCSQCPVTRRRRGYLLCHTALQRRSAARRAEQATEAFRQGYRLRAGGESLNSGVKRRTGMGRLRTRGQPRMRMGILLRCAGWNFLQAVRALKKRAKAAGASLAAAFSPVQTRQETVHGLTMGSRLIRRTLRLPEVSAALMRAAA